MTKQLISGAASGTSTPDRIVATLEQLTSGAHLRFVDNVDMNRIVNESQTDTTLTPRVGAVSVSHQTQMVVEGTEPVAYITVLVTAIVEYVPVTVSIAPQPVGISSTGDGTEPTAGTPWFGDADHVDGDAQDAPYSFLRQH